MGFVMPHITVLIGAGVVGLALLLQIIGLAAPVWVTFKVGDIKTDTGLWKRCVNGKCEDYSASTGGIDACRAFGILGVLAMAASSASALLICFMSERKDLFGLIAPIAAAVGAFCAMIEFTVFAEENSGATFGSSFALTIVACLLSVVAAVLFFMGRSGNQ